MRDDSGIAGGLGGVDGVQRLRQRADLVDLDEDRVGHAPVDAVLQTRHVGDEQVVAHQLDTPAQAVREQLPAVPIVLRHAVLDADDGVAPDPRLVQVDQLRSRQRPSLPRQAISVLVEELAGRGVDGERDVLALPVAGRADRLDD